MSPSLIDRIIDLAEQHSPAVPVVYDPAADAVMVPEELWAANENGWTVVLHPCRTMRECRDALGY